MVISTVCLVVALVCFAAVALEAPAGRFSWLGVGLVFFVASFLVR
jgi:hypothetical protein